MSNSTSLNPLLQQLLDPALLAAERARRERNKLARFYPDGGQFRRELYPKHLDFFHDGTKFRERAFIGGNRTGKTVMGAYEATLHLTGLYPEWWQGKRFTKPVHGWAAGDTSKTVREILQPRLLGEPGQIGTGMIPGDLIRKCTAKSGLADAIETVYVRHASGGTSELVLKSYDQRREAFQGTAREFIWLDEEPPMAIYTECLLRTMTCSGLVYMTFTPLQGLSDVVLSFLPGGTPGSEAESTGKSVVMVSWDDVPHLPESVKAELLQAIPPHQRDARSKGIPQLGSGAIYPVPESDLVVDDFELPAHWPRAYGLDVGWNRTAAVWGALDRESQTVYLYSEHYRGEAEPVVHAEAIRSRGEWIPGVIDPAARGRGQADGGRLMQHYLDLGLDIEMADNAVEAGLLDIWQRMSGGRFKVFRSMRTWLQEFRLYRRDEKGRIVKENDHLMDATRYLINSGLERSKAAPAKKKPADMFGGGAVTEGWMS